MGTAIGNSEKGNERVAYALNLCAASITQIIESRDLYILKQERELILGNLNLQNFVKHDALFDVIKRILNAITYFELQAGDMAFIEKEYQSKMKNAIWNAVPNLGILFAGGNPVTLALTVATQIGTGYMNYRRNKSQYMLDKDKSEWELKKHELEQLYGLRAQLFETAWRLSADFDFEDKLRLTETQLARYGKALLEENPLKRYERLDVMSEKFRAFPQFWYYKGNAAFEVYRKGDKNNFQYIAGYESFAAEYKSKAIKAYEEFHNTYFEFLREDIVAASCCLEHISLLDPGDARVEALLRQALRFAGENYDVLQQVTFVYQNLGKHDKVIDSLREMIANDYAVAINGVLLSEIYYKYSRKDDYEKLKCIIGERNIIPWGKSTPNAPAFSNAPKDTAHIASRAAGTLAKGQMATETEISAAERDFIAGHAARLSNAFAAMARRIVYKLQISDSTDEAGRIYRQFEGVCASMMEYSAGSGVFEDSLTRVKTKLDWAAKNKSDDALKRFIVEAEKASSAFSAAKFKIQIIDNISALENAMRKVAR